jgi:hypothetical protein
VYYSGAEKFSLVTPSTGAAANVCCFRTAKGFNRGQTLIYRTRRKTKKDRLVYAGTNKTICVQNLSKKTLRL